MQTGLQRGILPVLKLPEEKKKRSTILALLTLQLDLSPVTVANLG